MLETLRHLLQRSPRHVGLPRSRWWLVGIRQALSALHSYSLAGVWKLLRRLGLHYKRGRQYVHSPDPDYDLKLSYIAAAFAQAQRVKVYYVDELTYYRRASVARAYAASGSKHPLALSGHRSNRSRRIGSALNALDGSTVSWQRERFDSPTLLRFYRALAAQHPEAQRVFIILDNWSPHFQPDVLLSLQSSNITLLRLPTYAPWTNPVEQLWRRLKQELLHLHDFGDDWHGLQAAVQHWLDQWRNPSADLLRYVGLTPD